MTRMGDVWDRTVAVLQGRGGMLAHIAALAIFLPAAVRAGAQAYADPASPGLKALLGLIAIAALVVSVWGHLAILAAASDPAVLRSDAMRMATRRLAPAVGLSLIVVVVVGLLFAPMMIALAGSGVPLQAMTTGGAATLPPRVAGFIGLYTLAFLIVALIVGARLVLLNAVIVLERTGIGAFARSFRLTRGLTWRIIGVLLLYVVVLLVAGGAAQLVAGTIAALLLGAGATATFIAAVAGALVGAVLSVVAIVFTAQLYAAVRGAPVLS